MYFREGLLLEIVSMHLRGTPIECGFVDEDGERAALFFVVEVNGGVVLRWTFLNDYEYPFYEMAEFAQEIITPEICLQYEIGQSEFLDIIANAEEINLEDRRISLFWPRLKLYNRFD